MNHSRTASWALSALLVSAFCVAQAQSTQPPRESTRLAAFMDRDTFLSMHRWDEMTGLWVLKSDMPLPKGVLPRADVMAMVDSFLVKNSWDEPHNQWLSIKGPPRDMSKLTREQVRIETMRFLMTHRFDEATGEWISKVPAPN